MAATPISKLGKRIRALRMERKLTHEQLAEKAGISFHSVSAVERGTRGGHLDTVMAIAAALDLSLSELFLDIDRPVPRELKNLSSALAGQSPEAQRAILKLVEDALALAAASRGPAAE